MPDQLTMTKVAGATLDLRLNWASLLDGDTISSASWSASGVTDGASSNTTTTTTLRISGGAAGTTATATCTVNTAGGLVYVRTVTIAVVALIVAREVVKGPGETITIPAPTWADLGSDTISAYAWTVPSGLSGSSTSASIAISGGTAGQDYDLVCQITTTSGQIDQRVIKVQVRAR